MIQLKNAAEHLIKVIEPRQQAGGVDYIGIPTGFEMLDYNLGGLRSDSLYVLGGRSGIGKSAMAISMTMSMAKNGAKAWYTSLEMSADLVALRLLSSMTGIPAMALERGKLSNQQMDAVKEASLEFENLDVVIDDINNTTSAFESATREQKNEYGLDFAVADYASLFQDGGVDSLYEKETKVSLKMRDVARQLDIPVLCLVQLNRNMIGRESSKPILSDIKQTGGYEQDAAAVMFVHRPHLEAMYRDNADPVDEEDATLIVAKNRHGPVGEIDILFEPKKMLWRDKTYQINEPPHIPRRQNG